MMIFRFLVAFAFTFLVLSPAHAEDAYRDTIDLFKRSPVVQPFFKNAYGYAVFPTIGKGGIGVGAAYGEGRVYRGGKLTGKTSMTQLTVGAQLGGQAISEIIFFQDKRAYSDFTSGNFEFSAQASAVAITAGAQAQAGSEGAGASASGGGTAGMQAAKYHKGMAVFTHAKGGLMYEVTVGGQKFSFEPTGGK
jgi:lipid-binding SYLF domain-containing protein